MSGKLTYIVLVEDYQSLFLFLQIGKSCSLLFCFGMYTNLALNLELYPANLYSYEKLLAIFLICNLLWIK